MTCPDKLIKSYKPFSGNLHLSLLFQGNEADEITYASVNINKMQKNRGQHHLTQDTVYARIK